MSGGVDSSVAAALLLEEGCEVVGVTMRMWPPVGEPGEEHFLFRAEQDALEVASNLGIPHHILDVREEFAECVVANFIEEYKQGRTPNPCVVCNPKIKFGSLLGYVEEKLDARFLATGHYARIERRDDTDRWRLLRGIDRTKDQSYVLYRLTQSQLDRILMPMGYYTKEKVRGLAAGLGIDVEQRPESQDICFVQGSSYVDFLKTRAPELVRPGPIVDMAGNVIGQHEGVAFYTVGQRRGLGIPAGHRLYVIALEAESNTVVVGGLNDLGQKTVVVKDVNLISSEKLTKSVAVSAKIRYNTQDSAAALSPLGEGWARLEFEQEQRAVTPGQSAVFYDGEEVLGGGVIVGAERGEV